MEDLAKFLAANPYVLAGLAIIGFWPVIRSLWALGRKVSQWFQLNAMANRNEITLAARSPSYLISHIFVLLIGLGFSIWATWFTSLVMPLLMGDQSDGAGLARYLVGALYFLLGITAGAFTGSLTAFVFLVRREAKRMDSSPDDSKS